MIGLKKALSIFEERDSPKKDSLGDDYQCPIKGIWEATYKLDSETLMKMKDVLYVPWLKKILLSISSLDKKDLWVSFIYVKFLCVLELNI